METLIGLALFVGFVVLIVKVLSKIEPRPSTSRDYSAAQPQLGEFYVKNPVLKRTEQALYYELKKTVPEKYHVFANMRVGDVLGTPNGWGYYRRRNKLLPKHVDFLITDGAFKPILAIELNGQSHASARQRHSDEEKFTIFQQAGLKLEILHVGEQYSEAVPHILQEAGILPK